MLDLLKKMQSFFVSSSEKMKRRELSSDMFLDVNQERLSEKESSSTDSPNVLSVDPISEMSHQMADLFDQLLSKDHFNVEDWLGQLKEYSSNPLHRILYSEISNRIYASQFNRVGDSQTSDKEPKFTILQTNLNSAIERARQEVALNDSESNRTLYLMVTKIHDHVSLAMQQREFIQTTKEERLEEIDRLVTPKVMEMSKDLTSQLVGLISIFTALSFIIFGGISSLDSIFKTLAQTLNQTHSVLPAIIVGVLWILCSLNLLVVFLCFVLRVVDRTEHHRITIKELVQEYPGIVIADYLLVCILALSGFAWFAVQTGLGKNMYIWLTVQHYGWGFWIVLVLVIIPLLIPVFYWIIKRHKSKKESSTQ